MSQKVIQGTPKLADAIKGRRQELGLTIEEAASRQVSASRLGAVMKQVNPFGMTK